jgi:hypothetical protein
MSAARGRGGEDFGAGGEADGEVGLEGAGHCGVVWVRGMLCLGDERG